MAHKFDAILSKPAQPLLYAQDLVMFDSELEPASEDYHSFTQLIAEVDTILLAALSHCLTARCSLALPHSLFHEM